MNYCICNFKKGIAFEIPFPYNAKMWILESWMQENLKWLYLQIEDKSSEWSYTNVESAKKWGYKVVEL